MPIAIILLVFVILNRSNEWEDGNLINISQENGDPCHCTCHIRHQQSLTTTEFEFFGLNCSL